MTARPDLVYGAVLAAALLHAGWNALIKRSADTLLSTTGIAAASAAIALAALPWLPAPAAASWPFILSSLILQIVYMRLLARIYRVADMSASYPVMRGTAPLLVAAASAALFHEALNPTALAGIAAICGGILCIGRRSTGSPAAPSGLRLALLNAAVIASYTLVEGAGVRRSGAPASYTLWIFLPQGCAMTLMGLRARPGALPSYLRAHWRSCLGRIASGRAGRTAGRRAGRAGPSASWRSPAAGRSTVCSWRALPTAGPRPPQPGYSWR